MLTYTLCTPYYSFIFIAHNARTHIRIVLKNIVYIVYKCILEVF